ncbi:MAG: SRPBCC family protein [Acidobacteriota bacterium]
MRFRTETHIASTPETVWRHLTVPELMERWMAGAELLRTKDGGALHDGTELLFITRNNEQRSRVVSFEPRTLLGIRSTQGPFTATYHYRLTPNGTGVHLALEAECTASGLARFAMPVIGLLIKMSDGGQPKAIKEQVESDGD